MEDRDLKNYLELIRILPELAPENGFKKIRNYIESLENIRKGKSIPLEQKRDLVSILKRISEYHSNEFLKQVDFPDTKNKE